MPISGGGFPVQIASSCVMADVGYKPEFVFAASGGSVSAVTMMASEWKAHKVPLILEHMSSDMFAVEHNVPMLKSIYSLSKGSLYASGSGGKVLLSKLFDCEKLTDIEVWLGAYNKDQRKLHLMTNMDREHAMLDIEDKDIYMQNLVPLSYTGGDVAKFAEFMYASCAIPGIVPHVSVNGHNHVDGGVVCASPLGNPYATCTERTRKLCTSPV